MLYLMPLCLTLQAAAPARRVAPPAIVTELEARAVSPALSATLTAFLRAFLLTEGVLTPISKQADAARRQEIQLALSGCSDSACLVELARRFEAAYVVTGGLSFDGDLHRVSLHVRHVGGRRVYTTSRSTPVRHARQLVVVIRDAVRDIAKKMLESGEMPLLLDRGATDRSSLARTAGGRRTVMVAPLANVEVEAVLTANVRDLIQTELANSEHLRVLERAQLTRVLAEHEFQQAGCTSLECVVRAGKMLSAEYAVTGLVSRLGSAIVILLELVDIATGRILVSVFVDAESEDRLPAAIEDAAHDFLVAISPRHRWLKDVTVTDRPFGPATAITADIGAGNSRSAWRRDGTDASSGTFEAEIDPGHGTALAVTFAFHRTPYWSFAPGIYYRTLTRELAVSGRTNAGRQQVITKDGGVEFGVWFSPYYLWKMRRRKPKLYVHPVVGVTVSAGLGTYEEQLGPLPVERIREANYLAADAGVWLGAGVGAARKTVWDGRLLPTWPRVQLAAKVGYVASLTSPLFGDDLSGDPGGIRLSRQSVCIRTEWSVAAFRS